MIVMFGKWKVGNSVKRLLTLMKMECILMDDRDLNDEILIKSDLIVITPGIKQSHKIYQNYSKKILSELNFLWKFIIPQIWFKSNPTWIGITATNWKSTTTWITYNIFKWLLPDKKVWITWNFEISLSDILSEIIENNDLNKEHIFIVETSSFMLYKLEDLIFDYGILLNIAIDHLDWHKDWEEYRDSKLMLLRNIKYRWITSDQVFQYLDDGTKLHTKIYDWIFDLSKTNFLWKHNQENISAVCILSSLYFENKWLDRNQWLFESVLNDIKPLAHRLSLMCKIDWIKIYDDWICTSAHALNVAIWSFDEKIILIAWWYDKWEDYSWLQNNFETSVWLAILMWQTAGKFEKICISWNVDYIIVENLNDAIQTSYKKAKEKWFNTILYSPWSASFDMFKNVYHRIEEFEKEIDLLKNLN